MLGRQVGRRRPGSWDAPGGVSEVRWRVLFPPFAAEDRHRESRTASRRAHAWPSRVRLAHAVRAARSRLILHIYPEGVLSRRTLDARAPSRSDRLRPHRADFVHNVKPRSRWMVRPGRVVPVGTDQDGEWSLLRRERGRPPGLHPPSLLHSGRTLGDAAIDNKSRDREPCRTITSGAVSEALGALGTAASIYAGLNEVDPAARSPRITITRRTTRTQCACVGANCDQAPSGRSRRSRRCGLRYAWCLRRGDEFFEFGDDPFGFGAGGEPLACLSRVFGEGGIREEPVQCSRDPAGRGLRPGA